MKRLGLTLGIMPYTSYQKKKKRETSVNIRGNTQLSVILTTVILETQDSYKMTDGPLGDTRKAFRSRNE